MTSARVELEAREQFLTTTRAVAATLDNRARAYEDLLHALQGLCLSSSKVTQDEFSKFLRNMRLYSRYPGIFATTYAEYTRHEQRAEFEARVRRDDEIGPPTGVKFSIKPSGVRSEYLVLLMVDPAEDLNDAYGLDLLSVPTRKIATDSARDTGLAIASGPYKLAAQAGAGRIASSLRQAIYHKGMLLDTVEQRRSAFQGMVSVAFVIADLGVEALRDYAHTGLRLRIIDNGLGAGAVPVAEQSVLFETHKADAMQASAELFQDQRTVNVGTRQWQLDFTAPRNAFRTPANATLPWVVLSGMLAISLLLSGLVHALAVRGRRAIELADRITENLRASEARLAEAQRMTQQLIEALPNPIFFKGTDGRYLGVNKAWERFFEIPRIAFIGKTVHDLYPDNKEVADKLHANDQTLWQHPETPQIYETTIKTPSGNNYDTVYYKATYTHSDGSVAGLIGTIIDITERKEVEKRYRTIFDNAAVGITRINLDGVLTDANQKFFDMLGYTKKELIGRSIKDITHPDDYGQGAQLRNQIARGAMQSVVTEKRFRRKDGQVMWARRTISVAHDKTGEPEYLISVVEDITDSKQTEKHQAMEHAVTRVLTEAETLTEAIPKIIQTICVSMEWHCGARWLWDKEASLLRCAEVWGTDSPEIREFMAASSRQTVRPEPMDQGLVRRTFISGKPVWIADIAQDTGFIRGPMAARAGLHGAFALPLHVGNEVFGVMEFFHSSVRMPDEMMIRSAESIGGQIGQYMVRKQAEEAVKFVATHDSLTDLPNRAMFNQLLMHAMAQAQRSEHRIAALFIDLDHFKIINDTLGHEAGDKVLREVAERLTNCVRKSDIVSRRGGDEFVILIEDLTDRISLESIAKKMLAELSLPFILTERPYYVTASIGISIYPGDGGDADTLLKNADIAMYRAKKQGRNAYRFYSE